MGHCFAHDPVFTPNRCEKQMPNLELVGTGVQRLQLALERVVLSVQGMFLTVFTGLNHLYCYLNVTQCLEKELH